MDEAASASELKWIRESTEDLIGAIEMLARVLNPERAETEIARMYRDRAKRDSRRSHIRIMSSDAKPAARWHLMPPALALLVESGGQVETAVIIRRLEEWMEQNGYRRQQPNRALGCLRKAGLAENPRKGYWIATSEGIQRHTLSEGDARKLFDEHNCTGRRRRPER